jgi:hypothetical protein
MRLSFTPTHPDYLVVVPDYHPSYGLADNTRARVICQVRVDKLPVRKAAALNNLSPSTVYKWLFDINLNKGL